MAIPQNPHQKTGVTILGSRPFFILSAVACSGEQSRLFS